MQWSSGQHLLFFFLTYISAPCCFPSSCSHHPHLFFLSLLARTPCFYFFQQFLAPIISLCFRHTFPISPSSLPPISQQLRVSTETEISCIFVSYPAGGEWRWGRQGRGSQGAQEVVIPLSKLSPGGRKFGSMYLYSRRKEPGEKFTVGRTLL